MELLTELFKVVASDSTAAPGAHIAPPIPLIKPLFCPMVIAGTHPNKPAPVISCEPPGDVTEIGNAVCNPPVKVNPLLLYPVELYVTVAPVHIAPDPVSA